MKNKLAIKEVIQSRGRFKAIRTGTLEKMFSVGGAKIRAVINSLRQDGCPICVNDDGYYWETDKKSVLRYAELLALRAGSISKVVAGLKKGVLKK